MSSLDVESEAGRLWGLPGPALREGDTGASFVFVVYGENVERDLRLRLAALRAIRSRLLRTAEGLGAAGEAGQEPSAGVALLLRLLRAGQAAGGCSVLSRRSGFLGVRICQGLCRTSGAGQPAAVKGRIAGPPREPRVSSAGTGCVTWSGISACITTQC
jgi:hypothetical protein